MSPFTRSSTPARREGGAIIINFSMMLLFLVGFAAIAVDFGRLYIVRTELQTALDSCALAAAQELDGQSTSITRAVNAGITAGNLNNVNLQSPTWDGKSKLAATDISFKDTNYVTTTDSVSARYVQCQHTQSGIRTWLLPALAVVSGNTIIRPSVVMGTAVATRANAQSACPIPLALYPITNTPPNYGFTKGDWVTLVTSHPTNGQIGWQILDPNANGNSGTELKSELDEPGFCGTKVGDNLPASYQGVTASADEVWDFRFGVYKNNQPIPPSTHPDFTGYAYTSRPSGGAFADFLNRRAAFQPYQFTDFKIVSTASQNAQYGYNRRVVPLPILNGTTVIDFACMLILAPRPLTGPSTTSQLEFIGNASDASSPCTTNGLAGGVAGPLVPVLVR